VKIGEIALDTLNCLGRRLCLTIESTKAGEKIILKVSGRMDASCAPSFEKACQDCVDSGSVQIVLDFGELAYISSLGLGSLVKIAKQVKNKGGSLCVCSMTGLVKQVVEMTRLNLVFPVYPSLDSALAGG